MADDRNRSNPTSTDEQPPAQSLEERRARRHQTRTSQTYRDFLRRLEVRGGMSPAVAEKAAVAVLCALEQRLFGEEARDMEAQLPVKLTELLHRCEVHEKGPPPVKFGGEEMLERVGDELHLQPNAVEPVVRAVLGVLRERLSDGEAEHVIEQLPQDLRALFYLPV